MTQGRVHVLLDGAVEVRQRPDAPLLQRIRVRAHDDADLLRAAFIGDRPDGELLDRRTTGQLLVQIVLGEDLLAAGQDDDVFDAADHVKVSVLVASHDVAAPQAAGRHLLRGALRVLVVAPHDVRAANDHLAALPHVERERFPRALDEGNVRPVQGGADGARLAFVVAREIEANGPKVLGGAHRR